MSSTSSKWRNRFKNIAVVGESINIEVLYLELLPFFIECNEAHYQEVAFQTTESLYGEISSLLSLLHRCNRSVRLNNAENRIALDAMCRHISRLLKTLGDVKRI
jgi:hypothetical protein